MFNATKKARRVYVEKIDLRTTHNAKTDIFRVSVGDCILFDGTPDEMKKLVSILQSFPEIGRNNREFMSKRETMEINRILKKSSKERLKLSETQFLRDMHARFHCKNDYFRPGMNKCSEDRQVQGIEKEKAC